MLIRFLSFCSVDGKTPAKNWRRATFAVAISLRILNASPAQEDSAPFHVSAQAQLLHLETLFESSFPSGAPADAASVLEVDAHIQRLEIWRQRSLDSLSGQPKASFETLYQGFLDQRAGYDHETERLKAQRQLTPEIASQRQQEFNNMTNFSGSNGPALNFYRHWLTRYREEVKLWKRRSQEIRSRHSK